MRLFQDFSLWNVWLKNLLSSGQVKEQCVKPSLWGQSCSSTGTLLALFRLEKSFEMRGFACTDQWTGILYKKASKKVKVPPWRCGGYDSSKNVLDEEIALFILFLVKQHPTYIQMTEQPSPQSVHALFNEITFMKIDGLVLVDLFWKCSHLTAVSLKASIIYLWATKLFSELWEGGKGTPGWASRDGVI